MAKDEIGKNVCHSEIMKVVSFYCNVVNSDYQHNSRVVYTFFPNKPFGQLLDILDKNFIFLKTFNLDFSYTEVWFNDQNTKLLVVEDKINITLDIN